jgi:geranyl-CoA carboxylase alpha subunit
MVYNIDLVKEQIRIASGEPLGYAQGDLVARGHAIECRINAEDTHNHFAPAAGTVTKLVFPGGPGIRVDTHMYAGATIPPYYDSMIAKIISHGADRDEARGKLICGLEQTVAFGVTTNQGFLMSCLRHPAFAAGQATTAFIGRHHDDLLAPRKDATSEAALAALALYVTHPFAPKWRNGRSLAATFPAPMRIELDHRVYDAEIARERDGGYQVGLENTLYRVEIQGIDGDSIRCNRDGVSEFFKWSRDGDRLYLLCRGIPLSVRDLTLAAPVSATAAGGDGKVRAAMNGRVVAVLVKPGEKVAAGQPVMTLEAMKMEHVHTAGIAGTVSAIDVAEGEQVTTGKIVVEIEAA